MIEKSLSPTSPNELSLIANQMLMLLKTTKCHLFYFINETDEIFSIFYDILKLSLRFLFSLNSKHSWKLKKWCILSVTDATHSMHYFGF